MYIYVLVTDELKRSEEKTRLWPRRAECDMNMPTDDDDVLLIRLINARTWDDGVWKCTKGRATFKLT